MENTELSTIESTQSYYPDPSIEHDGAEVAMYEDGMFITSNLAFAAWLVASRRLKFLRLAPCEGFESDYDFLFDDPDDDGRDLAAEFYLGDPKVGARSMFNALAMLEEQEAK